MLPQICFATPQDAKAVVSVFKTNHTKISMMHTRTPIPSMGQMQQQIEEISREYPFLVCRLEDRILGYCYAHPGVADATVDYDVEFYVAVDRSVRGCGIATGLVTALMDLLRKQNVQRMFGKVQVPNARAEQLLIHFKFALSNHFYSEACMCGQKHEILWFDKWIHEFSKNPPAFRPIGELTQGEREQAFGEGCACIDTDDLEFCLE